MANPPSTGRVFAGRYAIAFGFAAAFMVLSVVGANYVYDKKIDKIDRVKVKTAPAPPEGANYLVIGSDTRAFVENAGEEESFGSAKDQTGQRSDTMMVVHVEPGAKKTLVVSFPRDLWVDIPGQGMAKINAAFNSGPDKVIEMLKANFGVEINHYLEVDFKSFQGIVKAVGSVPIYFPYPTRDRKTNLFIRFGGCARLNGADSLAYVRSRSLEYFSLITNKWVSADIIPDISRIARQQAFMRAMAGLAVAKSLNDPFTALEITNRVVENLKADEALTREDIDSLVEAFRTVNPRDQSALDMRTLPWVPGPDQDGQSVLYPDDSAWRTMAARLMDFSTGGAASLVAPSDVHLQVLNGTGTDGASQAALDELAKIGFKKSGVGDDPRGQVALTEVRYARGEEEAGKLVLAYVDPTARLVLDPTLKKADVALVLGSDFVGILVPDSATTSTTVVPAASGGPTLAAPGGLTPAPIANADELGKPAPKTPPC